MTDTSPLGIAVIGAGYWGPNLVRNFRSSPDWSLKAVCDLDVARARQVVGDASGCEVSADVDAILARDDIDAVAIATPARTHRGVAEKALRAGKHVLVEKPLADSIEAGTAMVALARQQGLVLMADHTYCFTPAVLKMAELVAAGELGEVLYVDSVRINLGLVQPDVDVLWDLAPHDLSILDYVLPGGLAPEGVSAVGADPLGAGRACVGHISMPLAGGALAHVHVNWMSPTKIRQMVIGGSRRTLVWDDLNPQQRLSIYDRGVDLGQTSVLGQGGGERRDAGISYRLGDTWSPALPEREPLMGVVTELAASIREGRAPSTDGTAGLRVLSVLSAASESLAGDGLMVRPQGLSVPAQRRAEPVLEPVR